LTDPFTVSFEARVKFERESGAFSRSFAMDEEMSTDFPGGKGAAVQAKTVTVFAGGESMRKDAGEVLGGDAYAVVRDGDFDPVACGCGANGHLRVRTL
jgi:hypothetical protein